MTKPLCPKVKQTRAINRKINRLKPGKSLRLTDVPAEVYHATDGWGSTALKCFMELPYLFYCEHIQKEKETTRAQTIGTAFHTMTLEPEKFESEFIEQPETIKTRRGKVWEEFLLLHENMIILRKEEMETVTKMNLNTMEKYRQYLTGGEPEVSFWKRHPSGLILKSRLDYEIDDLAVDLKSTVDPINFVREARKFRYDIQSVHYLYVSGKAELVFIPCGNRPPFLTGSPLLLDDQRKELVGEAFEKSVAYLANCLDNNIWPSLTDKPQLWGVEKWERLQ